MSRGRDSSKQWGGSCFYQRRALRAAGALGLGASPGCSRGKAAWRKRTAWENEFTGVTRRQVAGTACAEARKHEHDLLVGIASLG